MAATPSDSAIYRHLLGDAEVGQLFTDSAEVRAMMLVEGALAKAQAGAGLIPETAAVAIHRAAMELQIDPGGLAAGVATNAVPVPGLVAAFREAMQAPEHAQYLHWGATSQDIMDTALALRLRQALTIIEARLTETIARLGALAEAYAETPMVARTYGQAAVVTTFGAHVAAWGNPLLRHRTRLAAVRQDVTNISLSGAAGTLSVMGDKGPQVRASLATALNLSDPGGSWHTQRDGIAALAAWMTGVTGSLGKMAEDLLILKQSGIGEIHLGGGGASSTMPQKSNPVLPSVMAAIAKQMVGLNAVIQSALPHRQERDAGAWMAEWMSLPQMIILTARSLAVARDLAGTVTPDAGRMAAHIEATGGAMFAEALTFALTEKLPRPEAQAEVKNLVLAAKEQGESLESVAKAAHPDLDLAPVFAPALQLGLAPDEALSFAAKARDLTLTDA